ncbi:MULTISPECIES: winged helix DNA-binding domain-containing protein [unclassified Chitinophaga]|uniref:winged helix DNA-binding domain-containing protein n=1 Tax=unclassified Chitinophaga TaxID=2619133 RepID=UPI0030101DF0
MPVTDIAALRLQHQQLLKTAFKKPQDIVAFFGAMQAQEHANSKWGIGARLPGCTDADIEKAISHKSIIRTTAFRGTLHLIAPADVRWILQLIAPTIKARMGSMMRKLEMDNALLQKTNQYITKALQGGNHLTRKELTTLLQEKGINTDDHRMNHIIYHAAADGIICNGPLSGKQFTYTLLDEWLPGTATLNKQASLVTLAKRYFISHGPATLPDFAQWAGLPLTDARAGLEGAQSALKPLDVNGTAYWMAPGKKQTTPDTALLLPAFDEYFIGYKDRSTLIDMQFAKKVMTINGIFNPIMVQNGQIIGTWKRTFKKDSVTIVTDPFKPLKKAGLKAFEPAAQRYAGFLGLTLHSFS